jgi:hypothetical protein
VNASTRQAAGPHRTTLLARIERFPGKAPGYQATIPGIAVAGRGRDVATALSALKRELRDFVVRTGLGPTMDAVRPVTLAGLELLGPLSDRIRFQTLRWHLRDLARRFTDSEVLAAAGRLSWRAFEDRVVSDVPDCWDLSLARRFNEWLADRDGRPAKPVLLDIRPTARLLGCHRPDRLSLRPGRPDHELWRTCLHELAHHRAGGHRRPFVLELARVYLAFRIWWGGTCPLLSAVRTTRAGQERGTIPHDHFPTSALS